MTGDERKATLQRLEIQFFADGTLARWHRFAAKIGARVSSDGDVSFAALPNSLEKTVPYLVGGFHHAGKSAKASTRVHWHLAWVPAPGAQAPPTLARRSKKVGGYPGVFDRISGAWPKKSAPPRVKAEFAGVWLIEGASRLDKFIPEAGSPITIGGSELTDTKRSRHLKVEPPLAGITEVIFTRHAGGLRVQVSGEARVRLDAGLLSRLEGSTWKTLNSLSG